LPSLTGLIAASTFLGIRKIRYIASARKEIVRWALQVERASNYGTNW
jgi:hypothetical protein